MSTLDRYFARRLASTFAMTLTTVCALFVLVEILNERLEDIVEGDMPWHAVVYYYAASLPEIILSAHLAGLSLTITILAVFGRSASRNELTAMLCSGIPFWRISLPAAVLALIVSALQFALPQWVIPRSQLAAERLEAEFFTNSALEYWGLRAPVSWTNLEGGWTCHISKFNRAALTGEEVLLLGLFDDREEQYRAQRIYWDPNAEQWMLENGSWAVFTTAADPDADSGQRTSQDLAPLKEERRITREPAPLKESPQDLFEPFEDPISFSTLQLPGVIQTARDRRVPVTMLELEFHTRFALAALPIVVLLLALPLAGSSRRQGRAVVFGLAIALALIYLILFNFGKGLGRYGHVDPPIAAWIGNITFAAVGFVLIRRMRS